MVVCVNHKVSVKGVRGPNRSDGIKGMLEGGSLTRAAISMYGHYEGWAHVDQHIHCEVAAIRVSGDDATCAKVCTVYEDGHTTVRG